MSCCLNQFNFIASNLPLSKCLHMHIYRSPTRCIFMDNMMAASTNICATIVLLCGVGQPDTSLTVHCSTFSLLFQLFLLFFGKFRQNYHNSTVMIANWMLYLELQQNISFIVGFALHLFSNIILQPDPNLFAHV